MPMSSGIFVCLHGPSYNLHNQVVYLLLTVLIHLYACIGVFTIIIITNNFLGVSINVWTV